MQPSDKSGSHKEKLLSRRRILQAGTALLAGSIPGDSLIHDETPEYRIPAMDIPKNVSEDLKKRFAEAERELDKAIESACYDIKTTVNRYGITDYNKLRGGLQVTLLPGQGNQRAQASYHLKNAPREEHSLPGIAAVVDAGIKLVRLYDEANEHHLDKKPAMLSYETITKKIMASYQRQHGTKKFNAEELGAMEFIAGNMLRSNMANLMTYDDRQRSPRETMAANHLFLQQMERLKDSKDIGTVFEDAYGCNLPNNIAILAISSEEYKKQGGVLLVTDDVRSRFSQQLPIPDKETLERARKQPLTDTQKKLIELVDDRLKNKARPSLGQSSSITMAAPLGLGHVEVAVDIETLNPALHANRARMGNQLENRR